ncbi:MAG: GAF domain-containing protein [Deltaproteobacteria bacterium]|nr:GAF domain-containing protein [Deltaproteobacteria bacterium]
MEALQLVLPSLIEEPTESDILNYSIAQESFLSECRKSNSEMAIALYFILRSQVLYLYERTAEALQLSFRTTEFLRQVTGLFAGSEYVFYQSLILVARYPEATETERTQYQGLLSANLIQMATWADNCPDNFGHKLLLVQAEKAAWDGKSAAVGLYDQAITRAQENGFGQDEALANELTAKFWLRLGKPDIAGPYLKQAHFGYKSWGAGGKVKHLENKYPQILLKPAWPGVSAFKPDLTELNTYTVQDSDIFDLGAAIKASQAISGQIVLPKLMNTLIQAIMNNAGAERVFLILPTDDAWTIVARALTNRDAGPVNPPLALAECHDLSTSIVNYVARTGEMLALNDAANEGMFINDDYVVKHQAKSILCFPIKRSNRVTGLLYLENDLAVGAFTPGRLMALELLAAQAAISIQNAGLYLELEISERQLAAAAEELKQKNQELQANQTELEMLNQELMETNQALSTLVGHSEKSREETERRVWLVAKSRIMPVIGELRKQAELARYRSQFDMISTYISDLTSRTIQDTSISATLTPMELRLAIMIKNGYSSLRIAEVLSISIDTVKTHRKNIRKKLNLNDERVNLAAFLASKLTPP